MASYIKAKAKEQFVDTQKHYFDEGKINDLSRESSISGGEILALEDIVRQVTALVKKGQSIRTSHHACDEKDVRRF